MHRIVFEVTLDGSARKLITVRSALLVSNKLPQSIDLKLENTAMKMGGMVDNLFIYEAVASYNLIYRVNFFSIFSI